MATGKKTKAINFKIISMVLLVICALLLAKILYMHYSVKTNTSVELFFTQTSPQGTLIKTQQSNQYILTLKNVPGKLNFISNAPKKYYGVINAQMFSDLWKTNFAKVHPNASLILYDDMNKSHTIDLELHNAQYTPTTKTMTYTISFLSKPNGVENFHDATLFIDSLNIHLDFINQSNDTNNSNIVIFQKNVGISALPFDE